MIRRLFAMLLICSNAEAAPAFGAPSEYIRPTQFEISAALNNSGSIGSDSAKVGIMEFFDFQCGHCGQFQKKTFPEIKSKYIDTGKVKYFFRDFVLRSNINSSKAASIANCSFEQGRYMEAADILFANPNFVRDGHFDSLLKAIPGLDFKKAKDCLASPKHMNELRGEELFPSEKSFADINEAGKLGVVGTPAFVVFRMAAEGEKTSGIYMRGAQPLAAFDRAIESFLGDEK